MRVLLVYVVLMVAILSEANVIPSFDTSSEVDGFFDTMSKDRCAQWVFGKPILNMTKFVDNDGFEAWKVQMLRDVSRRNFMKYILDPSYYAGNDSSLLSRGMTNNRFSGMKSGEYFVLAKRGEDVSVMIYNKGRFFTVPGLSQKLFRMANKDMSFHKRVRNHRCN